MMEVQKHNEVTEAIVNACNDKQKKRQIILCTENNDSAENMMQQSAQ